MTEEIKKIKTKTMKIKKYPLAVILAIIFVLFSSYVHAFAFSYTFGDPISLSPGETKDIYARLQNPVEENLTVKAGISEGSEIAKITDKEDMYFLPTGASKYVNIRLSIPNDAKIGNIYPIKVDFATIEEKGTKGALGLVMSTNLRTNVLVVEKPKTAEELAAETAAEKALKRAVYLIIKIVVAVAIAAAIIFLCTRKKSSKRAKRSRR